MTKQERWDHAYHSVERVKFVKAYGCVICGRVPCDNAHMGGVGGWNLKGHHTEIVPLCSDLPGYSGHHSEEHTGTKTFRTKYRKLLGLDFDQIALEVEADWQKRLKWQAERGF